MDIYELDSYRLSDAVKFHSDLNPRLWDGMEMRPEVREALLRIADDFREFLGIDDLAVEDITVSGSNAAYSYTPHSDIDLHLIVDFSKLNPDQVYQELFNAKKYQYNDQHDIKVRGYDVELYVQDANKPVRSLGEYSIRNDDWTRIPVQRRGNLDEKSTKSKYEKLRDLIELALKSDDLDRIKSITDTIKRYRQAGLDQAGEFGPENLAFKMLRTQGLIKKLWDHRADLEDARLSLAERKKKKKKSKKRFAYGSFGGWFYPGYHNDSGATGDAGGDGGGGESRNEDYDPNNTPPGPEFKPEMPAGTVLVNVSDTYDWYKLGQDISDLRHADPKAYGKGAPQTILSFGSEPIEHLYKQDLDRLGMKTLDIDRRAKQKDPEAEYRMDEQQDTKSVLEKFTEYVCEKLKIESCPRIKVRRDPQWAKVNGTFGRYDPDQDTLEISVADRHIADVMRTLAHELVHHHQEEREGIPDNAGETGSRFEDEANAVAGRIMRDFREAHPEIFVGELEEGMGIQVPVSKDPKHLKQYYDFIRGKQQMNRPLTKQEQQFLVAYRATQNMKVAEDDIDEDWRKTAAGLAAAACVAGTPGCATTGTSTMDVLKGVQTVGRAAQSVKSMGRAGAEEELKGTVRDALRRQRGQIPEASGYIPTEKQKNDPRFKTALTVDIRPGQTGKEANKLGLKTDSQGRPDLLMKNLANLLESVKNDINVGSVIDITKNYPTYQSLHARIDGVENNKATLTIVDTQGQGKFKTGDRFRIATNYIRNAPQIDSINEDEELMEVEMSPSAFKKFLNSDAAEGIRAGFEAELIFRDTKSDEDSDEYEADYDADERAYSIESVIDFFRGGDGIGRNAADRLRNSLYEDWQDWQRDSFYNEYWDENVYNDWVKENIWPEEEDEFMDRAREELGEDSEDTAVEELAKKMFWEQASEEFNEQGKWYARAEEESWDYYREDQASEEDWLGENYRYMSDISNGYEVDWPYWRGGDGNGGERDWNDIGNGLERATGKDVRVSSGYHSAIRRDNQYIIEPDGSLSPDDSTDYGLEIVSPPMPLPEAIEQLNKVIDWANGSGDAYTNSSTGLHMGVSLPFKGGDVDPIKLILFMGDKDLLEKFDRASNYYTRSAYERLQNKISSMKRAGPKQIAGVMELMKKNLIELADRELQNGVLGDKYVSVNPHDGYIEFRGPGGDYLSKESEIDGVLENTMLRLAYAMSIAGSPELHRKEYAKKLYKMLSGYKGAAPYKGPKDTRFRTDIQTEDEDPFMRLFADYSTGYISGDELKRQWAETVLRAEQDAEKEEDIPPFIDKDYDVYDPDSGNVISVFHAEDDEAAIKYFNANFRPQNPTWKVRVHQEPKKSKAPPSRRAELAKRVTRSTKDVGEQLWRVNYHSKIKNIVARSQAEAIQKAAMIDSDFGRDEARARPANQQEIETYRIDQQRIRQQNQQQRDSNQDADDVRARLNVPAGEWTGQWHIKDNTGRVLHRFGGIGNSQVDANRFAAGWLGRNMPELVGQEIEVVPEMR